MHSENKQMKKPTNRALPTLELSAIIVTTGPLTEEPTRATLRLIPKANANSLP